MTDIVRCATCRKPFPEDKGCRLGSVWECFSCLESTYGASKDMSEREEGRPLCPRGCPWLQSVYVSERVGTSYTRLPNDDDHRCLLLDVLLEADFYSHPIQDGECSKRIAEASQKPWPSPKKEDHG